MFRPGNSQETSQDSAYGCTHSHDLMRQKYTKHSQQREKANGVMSGEPSIGFQRSFSSGVTQNVLSAPSSELWQLVKCC